MDRFVAYAAAKKGMKGALTQIVAGGSDLFAETRRADHRRDRGPARRGRRRRASLRTDVTADDVWRAMGPVWSTDDEEQIRTLLRLLMDGLRHTAG